MRKIKKYRKRKGSKRNQDRLHSVLDFEDRFSNVFYNQKNKSKNK